MPVDTPFEPDIRDADPVAFVGRLRHASGLVGTRTECSVTCTDDDSGYHAQMGFGGDHATTPTGDESDRRYREFVVPYGQPVYLVGQATREGVPADAETTNDLAVVAGEHGGRLLLADRPEAELSWLLAREWGA